MQPIVSKRVQSAENGLKTAVLRHLGSPVKSFSDKGRKIDLVERLFDQAGVNAIKNRVNKARKAKAEAASIAAGNAADAKVSYTQTGYWEVLRKIAAKDPEFTPTDEEMMKIGRRFANQVGYKSFYSLRDVEELFTDLMEDVADDDSHEFLTLAELDQLQLEAVEIPVDEEDNSEVLEQIITETVSVSAT